MKKTAGVIVLLLLCIPLILTAGVFSGEKQKEKDKSFVTGHVVVKFRSDSFERDRETARRLVSGRKGRRLKRTGIEKIHLPPGWDEEKAVEVLSRDPSVESVQVDPRVELLGPPVLLGVMTTLVPGDTGFSQQWYLDSAPFPARFVTSTNPIDVDVDIDAPEAWAVMAGVFGTDMTSVVGVIDSGAGENGTFDSLNGYEPNHEDLPNSVLFANTSELPADGFDSSDTNTLADDVNGWDFADADNTPAEDNTTLKFHGTIISGIIGAAWDNGQGIAGIGRGQLQVLPLRFIDSFFDVINAVEYAMDLVEDGHAVRVLNMSFKSDSGIDPNGLFEAVEMAQGHGIAVVAAAGNDSDIYFPFDEPHNSSGAQLIANNDDFLNRVWPAEYTRNSGISNVLAVAATGTNGALSDFSNIGPNSMQIAAPGDNIYSTYRGTSQYAFAAGTSFSTPIAGAALGLVMAAHPVLSPAQAIDRVIQGGDFDARLAGLIESGKRVNMAGALAPFAPYSGLAYLDTNVTISMYTDSISQTYGTVIPAGIDMAWSTTPAAANMISAGARTLTLTPTAPGIAQFTLNFAGSSAAVGTYDTGPWRVTAIYPFSAQVHIGRTRTFQSLFPPLAGSVSWSVMDTSVAEINSSGVLTGKSEGMTRVILSIDGVERDYSGQILVQSSSAFNKPSSGAGCGTTSSPSGPYWPGAAGIMLVGTMLFLIRWRYQAALADPRSNIQDPRRR
jgi:hypothetical protein